MGVHNIMSQEEFDKAQSGDEIMVIDFFATWCGPCKAIAPKVLEFSNNPEYAAAKFYKLDVDELSSLAQKLNVRAMPTFKIMKGQQELAEVVGANPQKLESAIRKALGLE